MQAGVKKGGALLSLDNAEQASASGSARKGCPNAAGQEGIPLRIARLAAAGRGSVRDVSTVPTV